MPWLNIPRHGLAAGRIGDHVYVLGGATEVGGRGTSDVNERFFVNEFLVCVVLEANQRAPFSLRQALKAMGKNIRGFCSARTGAFFGCAWINALQPRHYGGVRGRPLE